jgi:CHAT domain-containing protein/tetratricopeptide (TPR) repeat protein
MLRALVFIAAAVGPSWLWAGTAAAETSTEAFERIIRNGAKLGEPLGLDQPRGERIDDLQAQYRTLFAQGRVADAIPLAERALALLRRRFPNSNQLGVGLNDLALLYSRGGRAKEAVPLMREAIALWERRGDQASVASGSTMLAEMEMALGRLGEAEALARRALALQERIGAPPADIATTLNNLATILETADRFDEAGALHDRALALRERSLGPRHADVAQSHVNRSVNRLRRGQFAGAEADARTAMDILSATKGPQHPDTLRAEGNLALLYQQSGRVREAIAILERLIPPFQRAVGPESTDVVTLRNNLAVALMGENKFEQAETEFRKLDDLLRRLVQPNHPVRLQVLGNLALTQLSQRRPAEAIGTLEQVVTLRRGTPDGSPLALAEAELNLGMALLLAERPVDAIERLRAGVDRLRRSVGDGHPNVVTAYGNLGGALLAVGRIDEALSALREAARVAAARPWLDRSRPSTLLAAGPAESGARALRPAEIERGFQRIHLAAVAAKRRGSVAATDAALIEEAFQVAQGILDGAAGAALRQVGQRIASSTSPISAKVKELQTLVDRLPAVEQRMLAAAAPDAARQARDALTAAQSRIAALEAEVIALDPAFARLVAPRPLDIAAARARLRDDQALVLLVPTPGIATGSGTVPGDVHVIVVTRTAQRMVTTGMSPATLAEDVAALRCGLDVVGAWQGTGVERCTRLVGPYDTVDQNNGRPLPFDLLRAHRLYTGLLGPIAAETAGKDLLVVVDGPLGSLPLHTLLTAPPSTRFATGGAEFAALPWLANAHAVTVLPSVASLAVLADLPPSRATRPYLAFANPLLDGEPGNEAHRRRAALARAARDCATVRPPPPPGGTSGGTASLSPTGIADVAALRTEAPLPETADEVCAVADAFGAGAGDVRLAGAMREPVIKGERLADYRVIHFATHAMLAGSVRGNDEPGLVLTPPATGTRADDGYLAASEVAELDLDAEWVILSACNTAGAQQPGAEPLSGLARAFFYARARSLLVSHWYVSSNATVDLVTRAFADPAAAMGPRRAAVLQAAMRSMIANGHHPSRWAPFVVVGGG